MNFSAAMLAARLVVGVVASLAAGAACVAIAQSARAAIYIFALLLLALFVPVHVWLWAKFPLWYHIVFLSSLVPLVVLGARLPGPRGMSAAQPLAQPDAPSAAARSNSLARPPFRRAG